MPKFVICPKCSKEVKLKASSKEHSILTCKECGADLEIIKKKKKLDTQLVEKLDGSLEIEDPEWSGYDE